MNCWGDTGNCLWCDPGVRENCAGAEVVPVSVPAPISPKANRSAWRNRHLAYPAEENVVRLAPRRKRDEPNVVIPRRQLEWIVQQVIENIETMRRRKGA